MKKYKLGLLAVLFVFGLFIFNTNSAVAVVPGCTSTAGWSATTGESCVPTTTPPTYECKNGYDVKTGFICGCTSTKGYSATTGQYCGKTTTPPDYQSPIISGVSGPQYLDVNGTGTWTVKAYDRNGGDLFYNVTWGDELFYSMTGNAAHSLQQSATFTHSYSQMGDYTPRFTVTNNNGQSAQTSLSVRVGNGETPPDPSFITILSPNGGETWVKGTTQTIKWKSKIDYPTCSAGASCVSAAPRTYDITLNQYQTPCTTKICPSYPYYQPRTIAKNISGSSYNWKIPNWSGDSQDSSAFEVLVGQYEIQVCQTGIDNCDSSNKPFSIVSELPIIIPPSFDCKNGYDVNTGFRCGCTSTSGYSSYDGKSCRLETLPPGCNSVYGYSSTTGKPCSEKAIPIPMPNPTPVATCTITSTLRLGSTGADVSCLQSRIGLISDGKFGPRTQIAVKAFQANAGLKADGIVGPRSISALEVAN